MKRPFRPAPKLATTPYASARPSRACAKSALGQGGSPLHQASWRGLGSDCEAHPVTPLAEREAEKRAGRQRVLDRLERGEITSEELNQQNGALARAMRGARIDFSTARSLG